MDTIVVCTRAYNISSWYVSGGVGHNLLYVYVCNSRLACVHTNMLNRFQIELDFNIIFYLNRNCLLVIDSNIIMKANGLVERFNHFAHAPRVNNKLAVNLQHSNLYYY